MVMELGRQGRGIGLGLFQHQRQMPNFKQILTYVELSWFLTSYSFSFIHSLFFASPRPLLQTLIWTQLYSLQKRRLITHANAKSKSEKFPPPHQDGALGYPLGCSNHMEPTFEPPDPSSFSTVFPCDKTAVPTWSGPLVDPPGGNQKRKHKSGRSSKQPSTARAR